MAKRISDEGRIIGMMQYGSLERAQTLLNIAIEVVKLRKAAESPQPTRKQRKAKPTKADANELQPAQ